MVRRFEGRALDSIRDTYIVEVCTVRGKTSRSAHLTSPLIKDSVREGEERWSTVAAANAARVEEAEDRAHSVNRLHKLGPIRRVLRQRFQYPRHARSMLEAQRNALDGCFGWLLLQ